jgi:hypothetical protein
MPYSGSSFVLLLWKQVFLLFSFKLKMRKILGHQKPSRRTTGRTGVKPAGHIPTTDRPARQEDGPDLRYR